MSAWLSNLQLAFENTPVIILHGNVRDWYVDKSGSVHRDLTSLIEKELFKSSDGLGPGGPFDEVLVYSGVGDNGAGTRKILSGNEKPAQPRTATAPTS
jgi:hypothetical protein